jgi:hypothetical protein
MNELVKNKTHELAHAIEYLPVCRYGDSDLMPISHQFVDGMYLRKMHAAKGCVAVGKVHKHDHINFLLCGEMLVFSSVDEEPIHVIGPAFFWGKAMTRKAAYFLEDTVWANVHFTDKTDV